MCPLNRDRGRELHPGSLADLQAPATPPGARYSRKRKAPQYAYKVGFPTRKLIQWVQWGAASYTHWAAHTRDSPCPQRPGKTLHTQGCPRQSEQGAAVCTKVCLAWRKSRVSRSLRNRHAEQSHSDSALRVDKKQQGMHTGRHVQSWRMQLSREELRCFETEQNKQSVAVHAHTPAPSRDAAELVGH